MTRKYTEGTPNLHETFYKGITDNKQSISFFRKMELQFAKKENYY